MSVKILLANAKVKNFELISKNTNKPENLLAYTKGGAPQFAQTLTTNTTISDGYNASAAGPISIANNITLMVSNNSTFTVF